MATAFLEPAIDCSACPRLVEFRQQNCQAYPHFHNAPVPSFGPLESRVLIVGLAPGLKGANWSGRPFTGDYAGDLLYPQNKTVAAEEKNCRPYLVQEMAAMPHLKAIIALGSVAHNAVIQTLGLKKSHWKFGHNHHHSLPDHPFDLFDSYHCSRYNTNTGRLTPEMFEDVFRSVLANGIE